MTVSEAIQSRTSVRAYLPTPIEPEKIEKILEAGRLAPSAKNQQHWQFILVQDPALRQAMVPACREQKFVGEAPAVLVVVATDMSSMLCGQPAETIDCAIALSFMMLQATELGLSTCWLGAFYQDQVKQLLGLPESATVVAVTPLGYAAKQSAPHPRKPLEDVAVYK